MLRAVEVLGSRDILPCKYLIKVVYFTQTFIFFSIARFGFAFSIPDFEYYFT